MLHRTWQELEYRLDALRATKGAHIEVYWSQYKTSRVSLWSTANRIRLAQFVCEPQFFKTPKGLCGQTVYVNKKIGLSHPQLVVTGILLCSEIWSLQFTFELKCSVNSVHHFTWYIYLWLDNPLLDLGRFFSFLILCIVGRTAWTGDQSVERPLPTHRTE
jgi:hypothetical protein